MFPPMMIQWFSRHWKSRRGIPLGTRSFAAYTEASVIGIFAALSAVFLKNCSGWLGTMRLRAASELPPWLVLPLIGISLGFLAGWMVERFAPEAAGGGVPRIKASLSCIKNRLSWRVAFVKLFASIITIGSGITMGRQAPTVHVGASLAGGLSRWVPNSPVRRRQMITAGAAAGLAAAFNAPISGVLFVVEELLHDLSGLTLGTAIMASFIGGVVSRLLGDNSLDLNLQLTRYNSSFSLPEIPFYLLLGVLAGIFAALFHRCLLLSINVYKRFNISLSLRVALVGLICGIVIAFLPEDFRNNAGIREFMTTGQSSIFRAAVVFVTHFCLTSIAFGSGAPAGLFGPSLILGSSLGYGIGRVAELFIPGISPTTYALAGMGAFFSGFSKVPITAIVIIFEMTRDFNLVLPLMIGSVISYIISDKIAPGSLNDKLLQLKGTKVQKQNPTENVLGKLTVEDVMHYPVETLDADMSYEEAFQRFSNSPYRGFPVLESGKLVGVITQIDIHKTDLTRLRNGSISVREIMTSNPITVTPTQNLSSVLCILDRYEITRLPVLECKRLVGIITRTDIIRATAKHFNGEPENVEPQEEPSYVVYQTQSPSIGTGRLLVPIANPETANTLVKIATAIARDKNYEIEYLQIIVIPPGHLPSETEIDDTRICKLIEKAQNLAKNTLNHKISVHTQIRVANNVAQTILEAIQERHIDLLLMGWKGNTSTPGKIFGNTVDKIIRKASCEVIVVKPANQNNTKLKSILSTEFDSFPVSPSFKSWLIPTAGGLNAKAGIDLLPAFVTLAKKPKICLTRVVKPSEDKPDMKSLEEKVRHLIKTRESSSEVIAAPIKAKSVSAGIIELANEKHYDVVVVGASQQGMLSIKQNIPDAIAFGVESTVILVRGAMSYGELHASEVEATSQNSEETSFLKTSMSQESQQTASLNDLPCDQSSQSQQTELFKNGSSQKSEKAAHLRQSLTKSAIKAGTNQNSEDNN
ncbi:chloride channel protein [Mastigocoleus sp. MO_188.B34]|uniref:chloride channel protein n=1 Tax=Mastigocoleus sp. MO_188.B34 TaxID=3036635 RepID=UPI00261E4135|nr:chloride channel protein [Mastigocoleus sp. MO_188.B34]MDJ0695849.1 chloride channel protein [Mastigocoleus sp. MO_188.B34]